MAIKLIKACKELNIGMSTAVSFFEKQGKEISADPNVRIEDDLYLMEIKIPGTAPLWLARLLSENGIFPTSFSKYGAYYRQFVLGSESAEIKKEVVLSA